MFCVAKAPNMEGTFVTTTTIVCAIFVDTKLLLSFEKNNLSLDCGGFIVVEEFWHEATVKALSSIFGAWI